MAEALSRNTQALLLLTAPLLTERGTASPDLLSLDEYNRLALQLREAGMQPADLLTAGAVRVCEGRQDAPDDESSGQATLDADRLERLLGRGFLLSQAVDHWQTRALWVLSRADADYPTRLRERLGRDAPVLLYGCGDRALLGAGGLAVTGAHKVSEDVTSFAEGVGALAASAGATVIVAGTRGVHEAAMRGALEGGGTVVGVLPDKLEAAAMDRVHRAPLLGGALALVSPHDPRTPPDIDKALACNRSLYTLADAALVVAPGLNKGVPWAGAVQQLEQPTHGPLFVRGSGSSDKASAALQESGALPWPDPADAAALMALLSGKPPKPPGPAGQSRLPFGR